MTIKESSTSGAATPRRVEWAEEYRQRVSDGGLLLPLPEAYFVEPGADAEAVRPLMGRSHTVYDMSSMELVFEELLSNFQPPVGTTLAIVGGAAPSLSADVTELWHYTDARGAVAIIDAGTLWASSIVTLNDAAEYRFGQSILDDVMAEVSESPLIDESTKDRLSSMVSLSRELAPISGIFALCASTAAHSLAQWRAYGGGQGHAVLLDPRQPLAIVSGEPAEEELWATRLRPVWREVLYEPGRQRELLLDALGYVALVHLWETAYGFPDEPVNMNVLALTIAEAVLYCKEPSFVDEQEVRMVFQPAPTDDVRFRAGATGVTPYLEVTGVENPRARRTQAAGRLPITGAAVGPFHTRDSSQAGLRSLLQRKGYESARVETSTSSLR